MARFIVRHLGLTMTAMLILTLAGSLSVSSMVEVFAVGTSWLGLDSNAGIFASVVCAVLAVVVVTVICFLVLSAGGGEDDDDRGDDDEPPAPEGPSGEPAWWPAFERELATYQREAEPDGSSAPSRERVLDAPRHHFTDGATISSGSASSSRVLK